MNHPRHRHIITDATAIITPLSGIYTAPTGNNLFLNTIPEIIIIMPTVKAVAKNKK